MSDPFRPNTKTQLIREAQIGLSVVAILLSLFLYVAFYKLTGRGQHLPEHVRNAPVAERVWPGAMPPHEIEMSPREFLDFRRSGLSQRSQNGNHENRMGSDEPGTLESRQPPLGPAPEIDLAFNQKSFESPLPVRSPRVTRIPSKFENSPTKPVPKLANAETQTLPGFGEQLKLMLGGLAPHHDASASVQDSKHIANHSERVVAAPPAVQSLVDSTVEAPGGSNAWVPPTTPIKTPGEFAPEVRLISAEADDTDFVPSGEFGSAPAQAKTGSSEFKPDFDFPVAERRSPPAADPIARPLMRSTPKLETANVKAPETSALDLVDANWPNRESEPKLVAPKPFTHSNAKTSRQLPRPEAFSNREFDGSAGSDSPSLTYPKNSSARGNAAGPIDPPRQSLTYIAREGDNFWSIAQSLYGDGRYFRALYKYNESTVPKFDSLAAGTKIGTPLKEDLAKIWPDLCPRVDSDQVSVDRNPSDAAGRIYVTKSGDTLFEIARQKLGQASRYLEIKRINDVRLDAHINHLSPLRQGVRLVLPPQ